MKCSNCGAIETEENPVEPESEECSACSHDRGMEFAPYGHPYRNIKIERAFPPFNEADCGGAFDGFTVTSDADPGL